MGKGRSHFFWGPRTLNCIWDHLGSSGYVFLYGYLEPCFDPSFDWKFGHLLGGWWSKIEVIQVLAIL